MKTAKITLLALGLLLTLILVVGALADAIDISIPWQVIGGGGGRVRSNDVALTGTIGQPVTGAARGKDFALGSGYWPGIAQSVPPNSKRTIHLPLIKAP